MQRKRQSKGVAVVLVGLLIGVLSTPAAIALDNPEGRSVLEVMKLVNDHWIYPDGLDQPPREPGEAVWNDSAYHIGNMAMYGLTNDSRYRNYSALWASNNAWVGTSKAIADRQAAGSVFVDLYPVSAQYLRYTGQGNTDNDWVSITEFHVYGVDQPDAKISIVSASANRSQTPNVPTNTIDDDLDTRWSCFGDCVITYDLGGVVDLQRVEIAWFNGDRRVALFGLEASMDGVNWTTVFPNESRSSGVTLSPERFDIGVTWTLNEINRLVYGPPVSQMLRINRWWWIDAIFMAAPVYAKLGVLCQDNPNIGGCKAAEEYWNKMYEMFAYARDEEAQGLYAPANEGALEQPPSSLWWRDINYINGDFWSRGNGWVIAAMARVLEVLPSDNTNRQEYVDMLKAMAAELVDRQQEDGFWVSDLTLEDVNGLGKETSGTALITYALAWGLNNDIFNELTETERERYHNAVMAAWGGMVRDAVQENGELGYIQGVGQAPDGPFDLEDSAVNVASSVYGIGAFLLAGSEVAKLLDRIAVVSVTANRDDGNVAENTIDDDLGTRWSCLNVSGQEDCSIEFDLGSVHNVTRVAIAFYRGDVRDAVFGLEASEDGATWELVPNGTRSEDRTLQPQDVWKGIQKARYLRYTGQRNSDNRWISITEFQVYGVPLSPPPERIVLGIEAVSNEQTGNWARNTIDEDLGTRWSCIGNCVVTYDLGGSVDVRQVEIAFYRGDVRDAIFGLEASEDGLTWDMLVPNGTGSEERTLQPQEVWNGVKTARYLRYTGQRNSDNDWVSITEFHVYGLGP